MTTTAVHSVPDDQPGRTAGACGRALAPTGRCTGCGQRPFLIGGAVVVLVPL
jgi:hypothetical protein